MSTLKFRNYNRLDGNHAVTENSVSSPVPFTC